MLILQLKHPASVPKISPRHPKCLLWPLSLSPGVRSHFDTTGLESSGVLVDSQCAGGQVCVLVFQFSVQSEAAFLSVVGQKRSQRENFAES